MAKRVTYWDIVKLYQRDLYSSKLYWLSAFFIILAVCFVFFVNNTGLLGAICIILGLICLIISKIQVLRKEVKF